jgi:hypothetical protein
MGRHLPVMLARDRVGGLFGTLVKHPGAFNQFLSMGHGGTSARLHLAGYRVNIPSAQVAHEYLMVSPSLRMPGQVVTRRGFEMRAYTTKEKLKITAGAVASLVIVGWVVALATVFLAVR